MYLTDVIFSRDDILKNSIGIYTVYALAEFRTYAGTYTRRMCACREFKKKHTIRIQDDYPYTSFIEKRLYWGNPNDENTKTRLIRMRTQKST